VLWATTLNPGNATACANRFDGWPAWGAIATSLPFSTTPHARVACCTASAALPFTTAAIFFSGLVHLKLSPYIHLPYHPDARPKQSNPYW
jgi:hypothetical protein